MDNEKLKTEYLVVPGHSVQLKGPLFTERVKNWALELTQTDPLLTLLTVSFTLSDI